MERCRRMLAATAFGAAAISGHALAQGYPDRTVEIVVPTTPGASADLLGRVLADGLSAQLGQRFIVLNKVGGSGGLGTGSVASAKPDGYTLMHGAAVSITVTPLTDPQLRYSHKSFDPICQTFKNDQVIVVRPDSPYKTVKDIVEAAKAKPGGVNYGHPGLGTIPHLAMIEIDFAAVPLTSVANGGFRMPGLFANGRNPAIADVPTVKEQGFDVAPLSFGGLVAPAGLPADVKRKLDDGCRAAAQSDAFKRIAKTHLQPDDYYADSAAFTNSIERDVAEKRRLLTSVGFVK
jgi:tripartite-type tricarboxylate transporter receptor subunit TctC